MYTQYFVEDVLEKLYVLTRVFPVLEPSSPAALIYCSPEITNMYLRPLLYHFGGVSPRTIRTLESTISTAVFSVCEILKLSGEREKIEGKTVTITGQKHAVG